MASRVVIGVVKFPPMKIVLPVLALAFCIPSVTSAAETPKRARPNIVVILSDDMGFSDIGCYGGEIETPHLDALAKEGLRFTQFYNTARCCPTRAALLTGLYPHQAGVGHMMADKGLDGYRGDLNRRCVTIAEALKPAGYATYAVGKWHVTRRARPLTAENKYNWPLQRGFDRYYGTIQGGGSYWDPAALVRDNEFVSPWNDSHYQPADPYYYTDAISEHAVRFIAEHQQRAAEQPFFLYVAYTAAHWPMHAREKEIAKYQGRYEAGYEAIRAARLAKAKALGVIDPKTELSAPAGDWQAVKNKKFETRCMEVYAAMIDSMDQGIGRVVGELRKHGQLENTLLLYLQDNGGCAENVGRSGEFQPRPDRPTLPPISRNELQHESPPKQTRDGYPVRQGYGVLPGPGDTFIAYGQSWANVSNTPFREYKHWVHEGGISTPLIAHWPNSIPALRRNQLVNTPAHLIDIMATCIDLAGADYPAEHAGEKVQPLEGVSLRPLFDGKTMARKEPIFFEHEGNRAVRDGQWKLVAKGPLGAWELYDIESDRTEMHDLAAKLPEKREELIKKWEAWAQRAKVLPWPWKSEEKPRAGGKRQAGRVQESAVSKAL